MKNEYDTALRLLEEALVIDKSLGLPEKIRQDLLLLAQAHERAQDAPNWRRNSATEQRASLRQR